MLTPRGGLLVLSLLAIASLGACYSTQTPRRDCPSCRGTGPPLVELGTSADHDDFLDDWVPWEPIPHDGTVVLFLTPGDDFRVPLNVRTQGLCWQESRFSWRVLDCEDTDAEGNRLRACSGSHDPDSFLYLGLYDYDPERGPIQSHWIGPEICPLTPDMATRGVEVEVTVSELGVERGLGAELCTKDLLSATATFHIVPVCPSPEGDCQADCFPDDL